VVLQFLQTEIKFSSFLIINAKNHGKVEKMLDEHPEVKNRKKIAISQQNAWIDESSMQQYIDNI